MDRRSTRSMMVLFAAALAFAAWGCGGSKPNYDTGDGGGAHDAQHDAQHDRGTHPDGEVPDGEAPDGQDDAVVDEGPLIDIFLPLADRHVKDGSIMVLVPAGEFHAGARRPARAGLQSRHLLCDGRRPDAVGGHDRRCLPLWHVAARRSGPKCAGH